MGRIVTPSGLIFRQTAQAKPSLKTKNYDLKPQDIAGIINLAGAVYASPIARDIATQAEGLFKDKAEKKPPTVEEAAASRVTAGPPAGIPASAAPAPAPEPAAAAPGAPEPAKSLPTAIAAGTEPIEGTYGYLSATGLEQYVGNLQPYLRDFLLAKPDMAINPNNVVSVNRDGGIKISGQGALVYNIPKEDLPQAPAPTRIPIPRPEPTAQLQPPTAVPPVHLPYPDPPQAGVSYSVAEMDTDISSMIQEQMPVGFPLEWSDVIRIVDPVTILGPSTTSENVFIQVIGKDGEEKATISSELLGPLGLKAYSTTPYGPVQDAPRLPADVASFETAVSPRVFPARVESWKDAVGQAWDKVPLGAGIQAEYEKLQPPPPVATAAPAPAAALAAVAAAPSAPTQPVGIEEIFADIPVTSTMDPGQLRESTRARATGSGAIYKQAQRFAPEIHKLLTAHPKMAGSTEETIAAMAEQLSTMMAAQAAEAPPAAAAEPDVPDVRGSSTWDVAAMAREAGEKGYSRAYVTGLMQQATDFTDVSRIAQVPGQWTSERYSPSASKRAILGEWQKATDARKKATAKEATYLEQMDIMSKIRDRASREGGTKAREAALRGKEQRAQGMALLEYLDQASGTFNQDIKTWKTAAEAFKKDIKKRGTGSFQGKAFNKYLAQTNKAVVKRGEMYQKQILAYRNLNNKATQIVESLRRNIPLPEMGEDEWIHLFGANYARYQQMLQKGLETNAQRKTIERALAEAVDQRNRDSVKTRELLEKANKLRDDIQYKATGLDPEQKVKARKARLEIIKRTNDVLDQLRLIPAREESR